MRNHRQVLVGPLYFLHCKSFADILSLSETKNVFLKIIKMNYNVISGNLVLKNQEYTYEAIYLIEIRN